MQLREYFELQKSIPLSMPTIRGNNLKNDYTIHIKLPIGFFTRSRYKKGHASEASWK